MRIADGVLWKAQRDGDKTAIRCEGEVRSYAELAGAIHSVGMQFTSFGGNPGCVIALLLENSIEFLELFLGLAHSGYIVAPVNPRLTEAETKALLEHMAPWGIISEQNGVIAFERQNEKDYSPLHLSQKSVPAVDVANLATSLDDGDYFYLGYSSGTTGQPKGLLRNHRSWTESFFGMTLEFGMTGNTSLLVPGPLIYSASLIAALHVLAIGATVEIERRFDAKITAERIQSSDIDAMFMVPAMYQSVADWAAETRNDTVDKPLICVSTGDKLSPKTRSAWRKTYPNSQLFEYFGSSEVGFVSVTSPNYPDDPASPSSTSVGHAFYPTCIRVVDEEIQVKTTLGFSKYLSDKRDLEKDIRRHDGWLASGDRGYIDDSGDLHILGRKSDVIVRGGINVYLSEIEQVVSLYPEVAEAAVFGIPDDRLGEVPVCAVVWESRVGSETEDAVPEYKRTVNALKEFLEQRLAGYKMPTEFLILPALPRNTAGKADKKRLRGDYLGFPSFPGSRHT